jgi:P63C domain
MADNENPQSKGGITRAQMLSPEQRSEIARNAAQSRWSAYVPKAATEIKTLKIGDAEIPCAVLEDNRRVLTQEGVLHAIGRAKKAKGGQGASVVDNPPAFLAAKNLKPFISEDLLRSTTPIIFRPIGSGAKAFGYEARLLPEICKVFVDAKRVGALLPSQAHIAEKCETLLRALAGIGIIALIDEVTGHQYRRDREELQKILEAYINPELVPLPWTKRFPDEFYKELFRLLGWQYSPPQIKKPRILSQITARLVYQHLPPGVWDELKKVNPADRQERRRYKNWRFLTEDIGNPHLEKQLIAVTTLMRSAPNWRTFERLFERAFPPRQSRLPLVESEDTGQTPEASA